jgi:hypothetical protein
MPRPIIPRRNIPASARLTTGPRRLGATQSSQAQQQGLQQSQQQGLQQSAKRMRSEDDFNEDNDDSDDGGVGFAFNDIDWPDEWASNIVGPLDSAQMAID